MELARSTANGTHDEETFTIELVWDADHDATAIPRGADWEGSTLQIGPKAGWLPAHLVTLAAASCFMSTLLRLADAASVPILGYVSISRLHLPRDQSGLPAVTLTPCIVVRSPEDAHTVAELCQQAAESSDVCRTLQGRLHVVPDTQVIAPASEDSDT